MFDNVCKFLAETFPADFATWLLGQPIQLTELSPGELSLEPIRADALILLQSDQIVLHLEFQTQPKADIPFRMIDYRLRVYRRFPQKRMQQVVIYLQPTNSDLARQTSFSLENTRHEFSVIRLWEQPTRLFLQSPGLLPFAVLSRTDNPPQVLQQVAQAIEQISDSRAQSNVAASASILAGLVLEEEVVQQLLRRDLMQESTVYKSILQEGLEKGLQQGREEERRILTLNLLREGVAPEVIARATGLSIEQIQQLQTTMPPSIPDP